MSIKDMIKMKSEKLNNKCDPEIEIYYKEEKRPNQ